MKLKKIRSPQFSKFSLCWLFSKLAYLSLNFSLYVVIFDYLNVFEEFSSNKFNS